MKAAAALSRLHTWAPYLPAAHLGLVTWFAAEALRTGRDEIRASYRDLVGQRGLAQQGETWLRHTLQTLVGRGILRRGHGSHTGRAPGIYWVNWDWQPAP